MIPRCYPVVKRAQNGMIMHVFAVFMDKEAAHKAAENANQWYGEGHPLTPLVVLLNDALFEPPPFPDMQVAKGAPDFTKWPFE